MKRCHFEYALAVAQFERADLQHNAYGGGNNAYAHQQEEERGTAVNDHCRTLRRPVPLSLYLP